MRIRATCRVAELPGLREQEEEPMRKEQGFTLIELLITVTVVALVLGIGVPGLRDFIENNRRAAKINELVASLTLARSEAIARNLAVSMCPSTNGTGCAAAPWDEGWIIFSDADRDGTVDGGTDVVFKAVDGLNNLQVTSPELAASLSYRPSGRILAQGQFIVCDSRGASEARVVQLDLVGRPVISKKKLDGGSPTC
jgi:type IV fimbrial biogenesis protein FimT